MGNVKLPPGPASDPAVPPSQAHHSKGTFPWLLGRATHQFVSEGVARWYPMQVTNHCHFMSYIGRVVRQRPGELAKYWPR
jgi:hypothetical protein